MNAVTIAMLTVFSMSANAGDKIGNGGGLWTCVNPQGQVLSAKLVDLFEAEIEFGIVVPVAPGFMAQDIAYQKAQVLRAVNPVVSDKIGRYLNEVLQKSRFVDAVLEKVDDALYRIQPLPSTCSGGNWLYTQFANFTPQDQVLIRKDMWSSSVVRELDKGALLIHEAVYRWMRLEYSDTNSVRSRQIVGLLFSNLDLAETNRKINALLEPIDEPGILDTWACMLKNQHNRTTFLGYGETEDEARVSAFQICEKELGGGFFCDRHGVQCAEAKSNAMNWLCTVENRHTNKLFSGKGRTSIEASYNAIKNCEVTSGNGFFCDVPTCKEKL